MIGGFSRAFDLISSEYHWTDEQIFDLPVCRLRQIVRNIEKRLQLERYRTDLMLEWQTKTLAAFIAATVDTGGKANPLIEAAERIQLVDREKLGLDQKEPAEEMSLEEIMEKGSPTAENKPGSFERAMRGFRSST